MSLFAGHLAAHTPEFLAWKNMVYRCTDPCHTRWARYGGAGIKICGRWLDFHAFRLDMGRRPEGHVLARRDLSKDFSPDNCYWERREETARRHRSKTVLSYAGETLLLADWAERTGLPVGRILKRLNALGWSVGQALGLEPRRTVPRSPTNDAGGSSHRSPA